jgi:hypothetical protein
MQIALELQAHTSELASSQKNWMGHWSLISGRLCGGWKSRGRCTRVDATSAVVFSSCHGHVQLTQVAATCRRKLCQGVMYI